jgi:hypothetical protein
MNNQDHESNGPPTWVVDSVEDPEIQLSAEEQLAALTAWVARGPQGPIEDDEDPAPYATQAVGLG